MGFFYMDDEVFDMELSLSAFMVYAFLVGIADRESNTACISIRKLATFLGISKPTVLSAIAELKEKNMIQQIERRRKNEHLTSLYKILPKEEWKRVGENSAQGGQENYL